MLLLENAEEVVPLTKVRDVLRSLDKETIDKKLFHQIFVPLLGSLGIDTMDVVQIIRQDKMIIGSVNISKFILRKAVIDAKFREDPERIHMVFEFVRRLGFSTIDAIKVFCNDRIA